MILELLHAHIASFVHRTSDRQGKGLLRTPSRGCFLHALLQATEVIVDYAQRARKPFAVVPCCVYSESFPRRRLPDGQPVKSYEDLLQYILCKDSAVQMRELPFEGRNKVLWITHWTEPMTAL